MSSLHTFTTKFFRVCLAALMTATLVLGPGAVPVQAAPTYTAWHDLGIVYTAPSGSAYYPSVLYDANGFGSGSPLYTMWYSNGSGDVFVITSTTGISWNTPITLTSLGNDAHHAQVLYDANCFGTLPCDTAATKYKIWYWDIDADLYSIAAMATAQSADGIAWTSDASLTQSATSPLVIGGGSGWNRGSYGPISLFYQPGALNTGTDPWNYSYVMYYDGTDGSSEVTGLAYSDDGLDWTAYSSSPVLDKSSGPTWDCDDAAYGTIYHDAAGYHFWYSGGGGDNGAGGCMVGAPVQQGIGYAFSTDGKSWTKDGDNPIFHITDGISYRDQRVYAPSVVDDGSGILKMYYSAVGTDGIKKIGLAVSPEPPNVVWVDDDFNAGNTGGHLWGYDAFATIQGGVNAVASGGTVNVAAGTYNENVVINKNNISLSGAGATVTTIVGPKPSVVAGSDTVTFSSSGSILQGFTITRAGNTVAEWNDTRSQGVNFTGAGNTLQNCVVTGNRNAILLASSGHFVLNNTIDNNRTGIHVIAGGNNAIRGNQITNNWTIGILYRQSVSLSGDVITNNTITGNWYSQAEDRGNPSGVVRNLQGNWFGPTPFTIVQQNTSGEPGYASQIPLAFGGTAEPPASAPTFVVNDDAGSGGNTNVNRLAYSPWLSSGANSVPAGTPGFQGDFSALDVNAASAQFGGTAIQRGVDMLTAGGTVNVAAGTYNESLSISKPLTLHSSAGAASTIINGGDPYTVFITSRDVTVEGFTITNPGYTGASDASGIVVEPASYESNIQVRITNNLIHDIGAPGRTSVAYGNCGINLGFASGVEIDHNEIYNILHSDLNAWANGVCIWGGDASTPADNISIHHNLFHDISSPYPADAAISTQTDVGNVTVYDNSLVSTSGNPTEYGVEVRSTNTVDARQNWWGSPTGPTYSGNAGGAGSGASANATFTPWLCDGTDTSPDIGFQPDTTNQCAIATQLVFSTQPGGAVINQLLNPQPVVRAEDDGGNLGINFTGTVSLTIGAHPSGGVLSGTTALIAANGVATFTDLSIDKAGAGYTLVASADGLAPVTSTVSITVDKANSIVTTWPTASTITYGQTLANSSLTGGSSTPTGSFTFTTPATTPNAGTASQSVTFTPTDTDNYNTATGTVSVTVNPKSITITPTDGQSKVYGATDPTFTYTNTALETGDTFTGALGRISGETVAGGPYAFTLGDLSAGSNYTLSLAAGHTFAITAKSITITPTDGQSKVYGATDPTFTYTNTALETGDTFTGALGRISGETVAGGPYAFTLGDLSAGSNYTLSLAAGHTFAITAATQTITFGTLADKTLGDADFTVSAIASSGLTVNFTTTTINVCIVTTGGTVHLVATGTCTITALQNGNGNYNAAPDVSQSFTVDAPANNVPVITSLNPNSATAGGPGFTLVVAGTDFVNGAVVRWDGNDRTTFWVSSTQLTTTVPAADLSAAGTAAVTVFNPTPGGGVSNSLPFTITAQPTGNKIYLPFVARNFVAAPDLVVRSISVSSNNVQVVIQNQGNAAVTNEFWVDVYINPGTAPTHVNQPWNQLASQGLTWGVTAPALPLQPGGILTLTVGGAYYQPTYSQVTWPLAVGTPVYAQVDSLNWATTYGAVRETHEILGGAYNNISGPVLAAASSLPFAQSAQSWPANSNNLPPRP